MGEHLCMHNGDQHCAVLCTTRIGIFQSLSNQEQQQLVRAARHHSVPAGAVIFREDDPADHIMVLHRGTVKLSHYSQEGKEYVLDVIGPNTIYGEQRLFSGLHQGVNATALEAASYCEIHRQDIETLIMKSPEVGIKMLRELGAKYSRVSRLHEILSINDARGRLAGYLLHLSGETGVQEIRIARETISASINLRTETISRKLRELEKDGYLALEGHRIIHLRDIDGLRALYEASE